MVNVTMNRAVHLARRDKHYEKALNLLSADFDKEPLSQRVWRVENLIQNLESASQEAFYALRGAEADNEEQYFLKVLELVLDTAWAVQAMVRHENLLEEEKSFLNQFLGESLDKIMQAERTYKDMGKDILVSIRELTLSAQKAFEKVREKNMKGLNAEERARYDKTVASLA